MKPARLIAVAVPTGLYLASMFLLVASPFATRTGSKLPSFPGYDAFELGFRALTVLDPDWDLVRVGLAVAWLANPALWTAFVCLLIGRRRTAIVSAVIACGLSVCVLPSWWDEVSQCPGYWAWWGSSVAALLAALFLLPRPRPAFADDFGPLPGSPPAPPPEAALSP